jgi:hypothetical protein
MPSIDSPVRPERRVHVYLTLPASLADALAIRAARNLRPTKLEAVHIVTEALRASGDLPEPAKR